MATKGGDVLLKPSTKGTQVIPAAYPQKDTSKGGKVVRGEDLRSGK